MFFSLAGSRATGQLDVMIEGDHLTPAIIFVNNINQSTFETLPFSLEHIINTYALPFEKNYMFFVRYDAGLPLAHYVKTLIPDDLASCSSRLSAMIY